MYPVAVGRKMKWHGKSATGEFHEVRCTLEQRLAIGVPQVETLFRLLFLLIDGTVFACKS
jgi:hypothetical protein